MLCSNVVFTCCSTTNTSSCSTTRPSCVTRCTMLCSHAVLLPTPRRATLLALPVSHAVQDCVRHAAPHAVSRTLDYLARLHSPSHPHHHHDLQPTPPPPPPHHPPPPLLPFIPLISVLITHFQFLTSNNVALLPFVHNTGTTAAAKSRSVSMVYRLGCQPTSALVSSASTALARRRRSRCSRVSVCVCVCVCVCVRACMHACACGGGGGGGQLRGAHSRVSGCWAVLQVILESLVATRPWRDTLSATTLSQRSKTSGTLPHRHLLTVTYSVLSCYTLLHSLLLSSTRLY
jgi:hypothetical protein